MVPSRFGPGNSAHLDPLRFLAFWEVLVSPPLGFGSHFFGWFAFGNELEIQKLGKGEVWDTRAPGPCFWGLRGRTWDEWNVR